MKHAILIVLLVLGGSSASGDEPLRLNLKSERAMFKMTDLNDGFFYSELAISRLFKEKTERWSTELIELDGGEKIKLSGNWSAGLIMGYCEQLGVHENGVCIATSIKKLEKKPSGGKEDDDEDLVGILLLTQPSWKPASPDNDAIAREQAWRTLKRIAELISEGKSVKK